MMAQYPPKPYDSYGYEDATPDVANRYGRHYTPPRENSYGYEDAAPDAHQDYGRPRYTPPIAYGMDGRRSSYHGAAQQNADVSGIDLQHFDHSTSLNDVGGLRRATMAFGDNLNAPPGFNDSRSRSGSADSDFLTSLISQGPNDGGIDPATLQRRSSLQEGVYAQNDLMVGVQDQVQDHYRASRRSSLQEALARNGTSPPEQMQRGQNKWDQHPHHGGGRRSSLPSGMGRQGSIGYGQGGGRGRGRYDQGYGSYVNQTRPPPPPTGPFYTVKLKRNQRSFVLGPRIKSKLVTGTYVKVEADRGEDLGIVIGEATPESLEQPSRRASYGGFEPASGMARRNSGRESRDQPKKILRLATREEVALLATRRQEEDEMHQLCIQKVRERGLDMRIVDAEYQFDRNKLTFYFEAERRVDFRDLVRELFMICGTRIWMCQINTYATSTASRPSNEAQEDEDVNEPIIAPPSEFLS